MMNRYTEISLIAKPVVYITLQEICDTHSLLLRHRHQLADSENDKLNELLDDLGEEPSLCSLLGAVQGNDGIYILYLIIVTYLYCRHERTLATDHCHLDKN